eukprot:SAG11_NODE_3224_length_2600_cov_3.746901_1_plen_110_part_00
MYAVLKAALPLQTLGVSMLVQVLNGLLHEHGTTEGTVQGPFKGDHPRVATHGANLCLDGSDRDPEHPAVPCLVSGRVLDAATRAPVDGAKIDVWLTSADGQVSLAIDSV